MIVNVEPEAGDVVQVHVAIDMITCMYPASGSPGITTTTTTTRITGSVQLVSRRAYEKALLQYSYSVPLNLLFHGTP